MEFWFDVFCVSPLPEIAREAGAPDGKTAVSQLSFCVEEARYEWVSADARNAGMTRSTYLQHVIGLWLVARKSGTLDIADLTHKPVDPDFGTRLNEVREIRTGLGGIARGMQERQAEPALKPRTDWRKRLPFW